MSDPDWLAGINGPQFLSGDDGSDFNRLKPFVPIFYDSERKSYLVQNRDRAWIRVGGKDVMLYLEEHGFTRNKTRKDKFSPAELALLRVQKEQSVAYAGAIAGYKEGLIRQCGNWVLVTSSPHIPAMDLYGGEWPTLKKLFDGCLVDGDIDQRDYFFNWIKTSYDCLESCLGSVWERTWVPGPVLALAGEKRSGKTLLTELIVYILGGRSAHPNRYMSGETQFNADMTGCEVQIIDDEASSTDIRARRHRGNQMKTMLFSSSFSVHGKNRDAVNVRPFWRIIIATNNEPENLCVLPPIDDSLEDKIMLLHVVKKPFPMPSDTMAERDAFWTMLIKEVPAFLFWLKYEFKPSPEVCDERTGVKAFKHPGLYEELVQISPEVRMLAMINEFIFAQSSLPYWEGSAERLSKQLQDSSYAAREMLKFSSTAGTYLKRLQPKYPDQITYHRTKKNRFWRIMRPADLPLVDPMDAPVFIPS